MITYRIDESDFSGIELYILVQLHDLNSEKKVYEAYGGLFASEEMAESAGKKYVKEMLERLRREVEKEFF